MSRPVGVHCFFPSFEEAYSSIKIFRYTIYVIYKTLGSRWPLFAPLGIRHCSVQLINQQCIFQSEKKSYTVSQTSNLR